MTKSSPRSRSTRPLFVMLMALLAGCSSTRSRDAPQAHRTEDDPDSRGGAGATNQDESLEVDYCDIQPILESKCYRCHGEKLALGAPFSLTRLDMLTMPYGPDDAPLYLRVGQAVEKEFMPPTWMKGVDPEVTPLSDDEISLVLEWIALEAPEGAAATCTDSFEN